MRAINTKFSQDFWVSFIIYSLNYFVEFSLNITAKLQTSDNQNFFKIIIGQFNFDRRFLATYAVFKLECLKIKTKLNHFALRLKLLVSANQSAFAQLKAISGA